MVPGNDDTIPLWVAAVSDMFGSAAAGSSALVSPKSRTSTMPSDAILVLTGLGRTPRADYSWLTPPVPLDFQTGHALGALFVSCDHRQVVRQVGQPAFR